MGASLEIQLIAVTAAVACALVGVFLVLRRMALMADAISHTVLLGIVLSFFVVQDLHSPWLLLGAALMGVATVGLVEALQRSGLVAEDAAIALVFPALFSLAVLLIGLYARNVHLDADVVLMGELALAPFERVTVFGLDLPQSLVVLAGILLFNLFCIGLFYKELKLSTFDPVLAATLGIAPALLHYGLMALVAVTAVGAFDSVGAVLVVALIVTPPAAAYLLTDDLQRMLLLSAGIGAGSALSGYWLARWLDTNIAGSMALMAGVWFCVIWAAAPERGLVALLRRRARQRWQVAERVLALHLRSAEEEGSTNLVDRLPERLRWEPKFAHQVLRRAEANGLVQHQAGGLVLTERGRQQADYSSSRITGSS